MELDPGRFMIWSLSEMTGGPFPPYFLEVAMKDGRSYYIHSGNSKDETSRGLVVNIYDFRAMTPADEKSLQGTLQNMTTLPNKPSELHPQLSSGLLRCGLDDILYVVQWERFRTWEVEKQFPEAGRKKMGFVTGDRDTK